MWQAMVGITGPPVTRLVAAALLPSVAGRAGCGFTGDYPRKEPPNSLADDPEALRRLDGGQRCLPRGGPVFFSFYITRIFSETVRTRLKLIFKSSCKLLIFW